MSAFAQKKPARIPLKGMGVVPRVAAREKVRTDRSSGVVVPLEGLHKRPPTVRIPPRPSRVRVPVARTQSRAANAPSMAPGFAREIGPLGAVESAPSRPIVRPTGDTTHLSVNRIPSHARPQELPQGSQKLRLKEVPAASGTPGTAFLRRPLNALNKASQKTLIALHLLPWLLLALVASKVLPAPLWFENWPAFVRHLATLGFGLYVLADTFFVIWHVAFRQGGRQLDGI